MELWSRDDVRAELDVVEHRRSYAGHTIYRVVLKVFTTSVVPVKINEVFVWRRYSEFKKLHKELKTICLQNHESTSFPEFIKAKIFGRFEEHIVEERQESATKFLNYVARQPALCKSKVLKKFFEGAVKFTHGLFSPPSDEPIYLYEGNDRLSVSGDTMDSTTEVDMAEEEQELPSESQTRGTWSNRQPTPDPFDANADTTSNPPVNVAARASHITGSQANADASLKTEPDNEESASAMLELPSRNSLEEVHLSDNVSTAQESPAQKDNREEEEDTNNIPGQEASAGCTDSSDQADDDVFGDFESYNDEERKWLRKAFSVCSDGGDIEKLASEADEVPDISSLTTSPIRMEDQRNFTGDTDTNERTSLQYESEEIDGDQDNDLIEELCGLPVIQGEPIDEEFDDDQTEVLSHETEAIDNNASFVGKTPSDTQLHDVEARILVSGNIEFGDEEVITATVSSGDEGSSAAGSFIPRTAQTDNNSRVEANGFSSFSKNGIASEVYYLGETDSLPCADNAPAESESKTSDSDEREGMRYSHGSNSMVSNSSAKENDTIKQFSLSLDDRMKKRIQRAIESDDYIYQASLAMSEAIELEEQKMYQASFELYKLGIGLLLQGVQQDSDEQRRIAVRRKTAQYLLRAENVYKYSLMETKRVTNARKAPINLAEVRTIGMIDRIVLVERPKTGEIFAMKVLHKCGAEYKNSRELKRTTKLKFIGSKYMVKLRHHTESSTGIYLFLEYISAGLLWNFLNMDCSWNSSFNCFDGSANKNRSGLQARTGETSQNPNCTAAKDGEISEDIIRLWIAQIVSVLSDLHKHGIVCKDLNPRNILLDNEGHIKLTYFSNIKGVEYSLDDNAVKRSYAAPESNGVFALTQAADWWSVGALLFELLTRKSLHSCYPNGIHSHSIINLPKPVSNEAWSLLAGLLRYNSKDRLGSGTAGCEEIKSHPFFASINWTEL